MQENDWISDNFSYHTLKIFQRMTNERVMGRGKERRNERMEKKVEEKKKNCWNTVTDDYHHFCMMKSNLNNVKK